jgi:hypothetical protein
MKKLDFIGHLHPFLFFHGAYHIFFGKGDSFASDFLFIMYVLQFLLCLLIPPLLCLVIAVAN